MSKDNRKSPRSPEPGKRGSGSASRRSSARVGKDIVEPEDIEGQTDDFPEGKDFDVDIEVEITDGDDGQGDRGSSRYRRRAYGTNDLFGTDGLFGEAGPFGKDGPFGRDGPFGKDGMFGPGGLFAKSGKGRQREQRRSHGEEGPRRRRLFGPGELRLVLLAMLAEDPRHGYELIKALEEMTAGSYSPSPGTIYPTLQMLADEGVIAEKDSDDAKKLFQATTSGLAELEERKDELEDLWQRLGRKRERARPTGSSELFRAMGNLGSVLKNKASNGGLKDMDKEQVVDLIDELARKIERL
ncbi:MAG: helix-turn-helix transcriptional regulator [Alteraurantiacibacter sp.]